MDLLPTEFKAEALDVLDDLFDTFKRSEKLKFYKAPNREVVIQDPSYISGYRGDNDNVGISQIVKTGEFAEFEARVWYLNEQKIANFVSGDGNMQAKFHNTWGQIKIQVKTEAKEFLKDVKSVWFEGQKYFLSSDVKGVGLFQEFRYFMFILEKEK